MIVKNLSTNTIISDQAKLAQGLKDKTFGLLLKSNHPALILKTRFGIHTFGLKKPIDVLVLDHENKVAGLKSNLKPNRLFFWNPKYDLVIELPVNSINKTNTHLANSISIS